MTCQVIVDINEGSHDTECGAPAVSAIAMGQGEVAVCQRHLDKWLFGDPTLLVFESMKEG